MIRLLKLLTLILWIKLCFIAAWLAVRFKKPEWRDRISCVCNTLLLRIVGVRLAVKGELSLTRPLLLVSNHVSYLDVPILGSVFPFRFTPKKEIASWFGIAAICRVLGAVFVDRSPNKLQVSASSVGQALAAGEVVSLFPEATTGNGVHLLPFRSGFFSLAEQPIAGHELTVQPAAIIYKHIRKLPIDTGQWPAIAWYGDMVLVPHLWQLLKLGRIDVTLHFLAPATLKEHGNRKQLAAYCHDAIRDVLKG